MSLILDCVAVELSQLFRANTVLKLAWIAIPAFGDAEIDRDSFEVPRLLICDFKDTQMMQNADHIGVRGVVFLAVKVTLQKGLVELCQVLSIYANFYHVHQEL